MSEEFWALPAALKAAVKLYDEGVPLAKAAKLQGVYARDVLHAMALRSQAQTEKAWPTVCEGCGFRQKDRPCVWPGGMCMVGKRGD